MRTIDRLKSSTQLKSYYHNGVKVTGLVSSYIPRLTQIVIIYLSKFINYSVVCIIYFMIII